MKSLALLTSCLLALVVHGSGRRREGSGGRGRRRASVAGVPAKSDDSYEACIGLEAADICSFALPTTLDGPPSEANLGELVEGHCFEHPQWGGKTFCSPDPLQSAITACEGVARDAECSFLAPGIETFVRVAASTSTAEYAGTKGLVVVSFFVNGTWTQPNRFFHSAEAGSRMERDFRLPGWPEQLSLTIQSNDAWGFWKLEVNGTTILEDPAGEEGSHPYMMSVTNPDAFAQTRFWIEGPPATQVYAVPTDADLQDAEGDYSAEVVAFTSSDEHAGTQVCVNVALRVGHDWIEPRTWFCGAQRGEEKATAFSGLPSPPTELWLGINSSDAWGFWKIEVNGVPVLEDPAGEYGKEPYDYFSAATSQSNYWVEGPSVTLAFPVPPQPASTRSASTAPFRLSGTCIRLPGSDSPDAGQFCTVAQTEGLEPPKPKNPPGGRDWDSNDQGGWRGGGKRGKYWDSEGRDEREGPYTGEELAALRHENEGMRTGIIVAVSCGFVLASLLGGLGIYMLRLKRSLKAAQAANAISTTTAIGRPLESTAESGGVVTGMPVAEAAPKGSDPEKTPPQFQGT